MNPHAYGHPWCHALVDASFGHRLGIDPSHPGELNPRPTVYETVALPLS